MERVFQKVPPYSSSIFRLLLGAGAKRLNRRLIGVFMTTFLLLPIAQLAFASTLTVQIGHNYYTLGDVVSVRGTAPANAKVSLTMYSGSELVHSIELTANSTGGYDTTYTIPLNSPMGIYTVRATSGTMITEAAFTVTTSLIGEIARQLIESAEGSQALAGGTMRDVIALGYAVPAAANTEMNQGQEAVAEAKNLHAQGLYSASAEAAQRAMSHFRNALSLSLGDPKNEYGYTPNQRETLTHRLEKLEDKLDEVSELISNLAEDDVNLPTLKALMESAESSITLASTKLEEGNYDEAALALTAVQEDLQEAMQLIKSNLNHYRKGLVAQFSNRLRERINASSSDLGQLGSQIQASYMITATQRLGEANGLATQAENRLREGLDEDAIESLEEASNRFRLGLSEVGNDDLSQGLMQLNMIRCQIQVQQGLAERLRIRGQDASTVEAQIQKLQGLVNEGLKRMRQGDYSGANGLFGEAEQGGQYYGSWQRGSGSGKGSGGGK